MEKEKLEYYKKKLEEEKTLLHKELGTIGQVNPENSEDFEPKKSDLDIDTADRNEVADDLAEFGNNTAITIDLEVRLAEVNKALEKINTGTYGICEVSGQPIEEDRLEANPAARTCKAHLNDHLN